MIRGCVCGLLCSEVVTVECDIVRCLEWHNHSGLMEMVMTVVAVFGVCTVVCARFDCVCVRPWFVFCVCRSVRELCV